MANDEKYFNAPIQLYAGFILNTNEVLTNVANYACFAYAIKTSCSFKDAAIFFGIRFGNSKQSEIDGKKLYDSIPVNSPTAGIGLKMYRQFQSEGKTDFEKVCLLAFLAIKSILQTKPYCKITNNYLWARMDGKPTAVKDVWQLSNQMVKYANEYQTVKIKNELRNNWGLVTYSRYTRGFYVSFSMSLQSLVLQAERKRKSTIEKKYKAIEKDAVKAALEQLKTEQDQSKTITRPIKKGF